MMSNVCVAEAFIDIRTDMHQSKIVRVNEKKKILRLRLRQKAKIEERTEDIEIQKQKII